MAEAACRGLDPAMFFPERGGPTTEALAVCARCSVVEECRDYGRKFSHRQGIWGGVSGNTRRRAGGNGYSKKVRAA